MAICGIPTDYRNHALPQDSGSPVSLRHPLARRVLAQRRLEFGLERRKRFQPGSCIEQARALLHRVFGGNSLEALFGRASVMMRRHG